MKKPAQAKHLQHLILAASTAFGLVTGQTAFLQNPSFESNYNDTFPHYSAVDSWNGGSGIDEDAGPFHNTGTAIPDQLRVAFIQGSDKTMSQDISGLTPGKKYWIQFYYDARNCCGGSINLATKFNDTQLDNIVNIKPAASPLEYYFRSVEFTPDTDSGTLAFATTGDGGDATVVIDAVTIVQRDDGNVILSNPSFEMSGDVADPGTVTALGGWIVNGTIGVSGADNGAVPDQEHVAFLSDASSIAQKALNLVAGKPYQLTVAYNAKTASNPHIQIKVGGAVVFEEDVSPVGGTSAFKTKTVTFTATDITADIAIEQTKAGAVLFVDDVKLTGETAKPLPPLTVTPASAEMSVGEQVTVTITVPTEFLATKAADIVLQTSATGVALFVDASGALVSQTVVHFDKGGTNAEPFQLRATGRGSAVVQIVDSAGLKVANQFSATVVSALLKNPSFESTPVPAGVGYGAIAGWTGGSGINSPPGPFSDNGVVPDRKQVGFVQGLASLSQTVRGLIPGKNYWLQFYYNARNAAVDASIDLTVNLAGKAVANIPGILAVGADVPYNFKHIEFVASADTALLEFATVAHGDATLLLDGVNLVQRDAGQIVLQNPSFEASGSVYPFPGYVQPALQAGWDITGGHGMNIDGAGPFTDNGRAGDQDLVLFIQGGGTASQNLTGLADTKKYIVGFLVNERNGGGEETSYTVSFADTDLTTEVVTPVGGANPYLVRQATFTAAGTEGVLKFTHIVSGGDHTLLLDNIVVIPETGSSPFILAQPRPKSVEVAGSASFSVSAVGGGTLSYQWKKDGAALAGQTTDTLTLDNVTTAMGGDYSADVKNANGTATSVAAHLTVLETIAGIFDTGVDGNGVVLADAAVDSHYVLVQNADDASSNKAYVEDGSKWPIVSGPWFANSDLSKWIGPKADPGTETPLGGPAGGDYVYRLKLDLTGYDTTSVVLSGGWASDNSAELFVNGIGTGVKQAGFAALATFNISGVFKPGVNDIDFKVSNGDAAGGPTGLRVEGLRAIGAKGSTQPPASGPTLTIARSGANLTISWPASATGFVLESANSVTGSWTTVNQTPTNDGNVQSVTITPTGQTAFYRLRN
ncbi:MAG: hypothetical protein ABI651_01570 [Verrucomicrobiota bacterium]